MTLCALLLTLPWSENQRPFLSYLTLGVLIVTHAFNYHLYADISLNLHCKSHLPQPLLQSCLSMKQVLFLNFAYFDLIVACFKRVRITNNILFCFFLKDQILKPYGLDFYILPLNRYTAGTKALLGVGNVRAICWLPFLLPE